MSILYKYLFSDDQFDIQYEGFSFKEFSNLCELEICVSLTFCDISFG